MMKKEVNALAALQYYFNQSSSCIFFNIREMCKQGPELMFLNRILAQMYNVGNSIMSMSNSKWISEFCSSIVEITHIRERFINLNCHIEKFIYSLVIVACNRTEKAGYKQITK